MASHALRRGESVLLAASGCRGAFSFSISVRTRAASTLYDLDSRRYIKETPVLVYS